MAVRVFIPSLTLVVAVAGGLSLGLGCPSTEAESGDCPYNPDYTCGARFPCAEEPDACAPGKEFTAQGCLRPTCEEDADCPTGQLCYPTCETPGAHCPAVTIACTEDDPQLPGECVCTIASGLVA
jgi:hypothetical protein